MLKTIRGDRGQMSDGAIAAIVIAIAVVVIVILVLLFSAWGSVPGNKIGLHYNGGPFEGDSFEKIVEPGSGSQFLGPADRLVTLPIDQRSYTTCSPEQVDGDTCDGPDIVAATKGGAEMRFRVGVSFKLNTSTESIPNYENGGVLRKFYETICRKFSCESGDGWDEMLQVQFRGPIEQAIQQSVRNYTVDQLFAGVNEDGESTSILEDVQQAIATDLKKNINQFVGGDYFCGPSFDRNEPGSCPDFQFQITDAVPTDEGVRAAFAQNLASAQDVITARNRAAAQVEEALGKKEAQEALNNLYSDPAYIAYLEAIAIDKCAGNSNCTLIIGSNAGVNVNTGPRG